MISSKSDLPMLAIIATCLLIVSYRGLVNPSIEGLDGAHNIMDGVFFRDFLSEMPINSLGGYVFDYYKQYPALGFVFWPPFFPFVEGVIFSVLGVEIYASQLTVFVFAVILVGSFYFLMRQQAGPLYSGIAVLLLVYTPGLYLSFNTIMREIPVLALMALSLLVYQYFFNTNQIAAGWIKWQAFALVSALALYTKQTAFLVLLAIFVDIIVNRRRILFAVEAWWAFVSFVVMVLPLILFTLTYGKANLAQSVGDNTSVIMEGYNALERWSFAGWAFYIFESFKFFNVLVVVLLIASGIYSVFSFDFFKKNIVYFSWILIFYFSFSYFDNKGTRFLSLIVIPVSALSALVLREQAMLFGHKLLALLGVGIIIVSALSVLVFNQQKIPVVKGFDAIVEKIDVSRLDGNIAYLGKYRQLFTFYVRKADDERKAYVLQADDVIGKSDVSNALFDYRIRYILVDHGVSSISDKNIADKIRTSGFLKLVAVERIQDSGKIILVDIYKYDGGVSNQMKDVELSSSLL